MATITDITVERSYTINMGNFESVRLSASATAHLSDGEDPDAAYEIVVEFIEDKLGAEMEVLKGDDD